MSSETPKKKSLSPEAINPARKARKPSSRAGTEKTSSRSESGTANFPVEATSSSNGITSHPIDDSSNYGDHELDSSPTGPNNAGHGGPNQGNAPSGSSGMGQQRDAMMYRMMPRKTKQPSARPQQAPPGTFYQTGNGELQAVVKGLKMELQRVRMELQKVRMDSQEKSDMMDKMSASIRKAQQGFRELEQAGGTEQDNQKASKENTPNSEQKERSKDKIRFFITAATNVAADFSNRFYGTGIPRGRPNMQGQPGPMDQRRYQPGMMQPNVVPMNRMPVNRTPNPQPGRPVIHDPQQTRPWMGNQQQREGGMQGDVARQEMMVNPGNGQAMGHGRPAGLGGSGEQRGPGSQVRQGSVGRPRPGNRDGSPAMRPMFDELSDVHGQETQLDETQQQARPDEGQGHRGTRGRARRRSEERESFFEERNVQNPGNFSSGEQLTESARSHGNAGHPGPSSSQTPRRPDGAGQREHSRPGESLQSNEPHRPKSRPPKGGNKSSRDPSRVKKMSGSSTGNGHGVPAGKENGGRETRPVSR